MTDIFKATDGEGQVKTIRSMDCLPPKAAVDVATVEL